MMKITEVKSRKELNQFIDFPHELYKSDPNYVPEIRLGQKAVLNKKKNPFFQHSDAAYFLATNENGEIVGRIAAIDNANYKKHWNENYGFFGFFDAIDNQEVARLLFQTAFDWLKSRGLEGIYGPMNPSTNDTCGTLIDGFDKPPYLMMTHNFPYYDDLIKSVGLKKSMDLLSYYLDKKKIPERMLRLTKSIEQRLNKQGITFRQANFKDLKGETPKIREIYNHAWEENWGFVPMTEAEFEHLVNDLKTVTIPDLVYLVEDKGKPVAFSASLPNLNEIIINFNKGKLFPFNVLKLINAPKKVRNIRVLTLGLKKEYRNMGIDACLYTKIYEACVKHNWDGGEASWILENNVMMNRALVNMNAEVFKRYRIYKYQF